MLIKNKTQFKETEIGLIPNNWNIFSFGEVIDFNPKRKLKKGSNSKFVTMADVKTFTKKVSNYSYREFGGGSKFKNGDTIMARITPCLENGKTSYIDFLENNEVAGGSTEFIVLSEKDKVSDSNFVYYLVTSSIVREAAIKAMTGTSGRQRVENDKLSNFLIPLPPLKEQQKIAEILSSLDDRIELNRKINDNLEKIASSLFKRWFVDFEFPDKDGKPYKSGGGKMIDSELGEIPNGWEIKSATDLLDFIKGVEPGAKQYSEEKLNNYIDFFRVADVYSGKDSKVFIDRDISKNVCTDFNDILITTDGTVGRVATGLVGSYSSGIRKILPKRESINNSFVYFWLKSDYVQNILQEYASDSTTIAHASGAIRDMKIVFDGKVFGKFSSTTMDIFNNILNNLKEIKILELIRDSLLPKLMNGKIRVK